jgi:hypothetical protein
MRGEEAGRQPSPQLLAFQAPLPRRNLYPKWRRGQYELYGRRTGKSMYMAAPVGISLGCREQNFRPAYRSLISGGRSTETRASIEPLFYSGIFPCFFIGLVSRLASSERRAVMSFVRVWEGSMTASM